MFDDDKGEDATDVRSCTVRVCVLLVAAPQEQGGVRGGILADEMGMGKTIQVRACGQRGQGWGQGRGQGAGQGAVKGGSARGSAGGST